jgi:hypothetical protein
MDLCTNLLPHEFSNLLTPGLVPVYLNLVLSISSEILRPGWSNTTTSCTGTGGLPDCGPPANNLGCALLDLKCLIILSLRTSSVISNKYIWRA